MSAGAGAASRAASTHGGSGAPGGARTAGASGILREAMPSGRRFAVSLVFALLTSLCGVALLATSAWLITRASQQPPILYLNTAIVGVRAFALGKSASRYVERIAGHDAAFRALGEMRATIIERLARLAPAGTARMRRGDLLSRAVDDVDALQFLPLRVVSPLIVATLVSAAAVVLVCLISLAAGLTLLGCLVVSVLIATLVQRAIARRGEADHARVRAEVTEVTLSLVANLDVLTAYGAVGERRDALARLGERASRAQQRMATAQGAVTALLVLFTGLATIGAIAATSPEVVSGTLPSELMAVAVLVPTAMFEVVAEVPLALSSWRQVQRSARRIDTAVPSEVPAEIPLDDAPGLAAGAEDATGPTPTPPTELPRVPRIELRDVAIHWPGERAASVSGISAVIEPGERLLISGPSGAGKTTIAYALTGLLAYEGSILVDGHELRDLGGPRVRETIGLCEQQPHLFDQTVRQNLLFARDTATDDELEAALARVDLAEWAAARGGLDAEVGERGRLTSGGQAQRIALARALLADFGVVIFDEPTASVDEARADALMRDLLRAGDDRSVIVISHTPIAEELITRHLRVGVSREASSPASPRYPG